MILDSDLLELVQLKCLKDNGKVMKELNNKNLANNYEEACRGIVNPTPIQQFYKNQVIFITGGTGFIGKVLIEKLLRCCSDIKRIYILVRPKKGKDIQQRIQDFQNDSVFDRIRPKLWDLGKRIVGVAGDCSLSNLGLSDNAMSLLKNKVTIVFHLAATVRFDEKLKQATATNIQSTSSILDLCRGMKQLKSVVHVSTAYANCFMSDIEEKFYDYSIRHEELVYLVNVLPEDIVNSITPQLIGSWPNTYTFTKALAEDLVRTQSQNLPTGIFRPGIVISAAYEPKPGWTDNYNGPTGIIAGAASGVLRTVHVDNAKISNLVPVDLTINALIASAWDVSTQFDRKDENMLIYNFTSTTEAPLSWGMFKKTTEKFVNQYPSKITVWYYILQTTEYKYLYLIYTFFLHYIPGLFIDLVARIIGKTPRFQKAYRKIKKMSDVVNYFCMNDWKFRDDNVQRMWSRLDSRDQQLFEFSMKGFDWPKYLSNYVKGIRVFLFKDHMNTLDISRKKYNWLFVIHKLLIMLIGVLSFWMFWKIFHALLLILNIIKIWYY